MRVLVCGSRAATELEPVLVAMRALNIGPGDVVIHGACRGVDMLADEAARIRGADVEPYPADWSLGRSAGPTRNARMLAQGRPQYVLAFRGGRGTADMVRKAEAAGIPVRRVS